MDTSSFAPPGPGLVCPNFNSWWAQSFKSATTGEDAHPASPLLSGNRLEIIPLWRLWNNVTVGNIVFTVHKSFWGEQVWITITVRGRQRISENYSFSARLNSENSCTAATVTVTVSDSVGSDLLLVQNRFGAHSEFICNDLVANGT